MGSGLPASTTATSAARTASGSDSARTWAVGEPERLAALRQYQILDTAPERSFDEFVEIAAVACGAPMALVGLVDDRRQWIKARIGLSLESVPVDDTFCGHVVATGQPLVVADALQDPRFAHLPLVTGGPKIRFYAGMPLTTPSGHVVGTLSVLDVRPRQLTDAARGILERLSHRVVDALELRLRSRDLELERQLLASTGAVLNMITNGAGLKEVLTTVATAVQQQDPEVLCSILLLEGTTLRDGAAPGLPAFYRQAIDGIEIGPEVGSCGTAAFTRRQVVSTDLTSDPRWAGFLDLALQAGLRACWSSPIMDHQDVLGTFAVYFTRPREPEPRHWQLIQRWTDLAGLAITRTRAQEQMRRMAMTDPLTGLPNRSGLQAAYAEAQQAAVAAGTDRSMALLMMDLDRFKVVNDSLGHAVGDEYLVEVAHRLAAEAGSDAIVSRFGGDEFVILANRDTDCRAATCLGERLVRVVRQPVMVRGRPIVLSASIGVAMADLPHTTLTLLLRNADSALYRAKDSGRDRLVIFDAAMHDQAVRRLELEADLRDAIDREQLTLAFQPNIDLSTGQVVGVEALARWTHPGRGKVPPAQFIPVAEDSGLILPLGRWVLRSAMAELAARRAIDPDWAEVTLWVNLSVIELAPDLPTSIQAALAEAGLPAGALGLEVTESALIADLPAARTVLEDLRTLGIHLAIDDFGTGYSSLSQLKLIPVDLLKIDKSFIDGLGYDRIDDGVVEAILALAKAHGLQVVAEGVEQPEQRDRLRELGCHHAQGYLLGRPGPLSAINRLPAPTGAARPRTAGPR